VDLEKAFDRVPRESIKWASRRRKVPERLINMVMALYVNASSKVKTSSGTSEEVGISARVPSGFTIESFAVCVSNGGGNKRREERILGVVVCR